MQRISYLYLVVKVWECAVSMVLGPYFFICRKVKHFLKFLSIHKDVCVQEWVSSNVTSKSKKEINIIIVFG